MCLNIEEEIVYVSQILFLCSEKGKRWDPGEGICYFEIIIIGYATVVRLDEI